MKEKTKDLWRAYLSELDRVKREARRDYEKACDRWDHYTQEAPKEIREEFE
jgi:vacuolar-type H+-ATPase subunit E/Vma4